MIRHLSVLLLGLGALPGLAAGTTIVPAAQHIDDRTATLALAEALHGRAATQRDALATLTHWLEAHPDDDNAAIMLGRYCLWSGQPARAAALLADRTGTGAWADLRIDTLIEAYLQLGRHAEAAALSDRRLAGLPAPGPDQLFAAGNARFFAGDPAGALPFFRRAAAAAPDNAQIRRALGLALAYTGDSEAALALLPDILRDHPEAAEALIMLADNAEHAGAALGILRARIAQQARDPNALMALADLEARLGHAAEARARYQQAVALTQAQPVPGLDLRHARARVTWGDFYGAETAYRARLQAQPDDRETRADLLNLLVAMDRLEEAQVAAEQWIAEDGESAFARRIFTEVRRKRRNPTVAVVASDAPAHVSPIRFEADAVESAPAQAPQLHQMAGRHAATGDFAEAVRWLRAARQADPAYFPAWLDHAEYLAIVAQYDEADREFEKLVAAFPDSRQVLLKQARALGWGRRYEESLAAYTRLRVMNPADPVPLLEQARVAGWAKQRAESAALFARMWLQPVDARLAAGLRALTLTPDERAAPLLASWRGWAQSQPPPVARLEPAPDDPAPFAAAARFADDFPALSAALDPAERTALQQLWLGLRTDFLLQRNFWLENRAKQLAWDRRWPRAEATYARLLDVAPGNQEALFDLAQVQAAQGLGQRERTTLQRLLALDPNNRLAASALFRRDRRSATTAHADFEFYREKGRDDLSSMRRWRGELGAELTTDDRFKFRAAFLRWREKPDHDPDRFSARGLLLGAEGVITPWLAASAAYTLKDYYDRTPGAIDLGEAQAWVTFRDGWRAGAGYEVRAETANRFAVVNGIRSAHHWLGAEAALSRRLEIAGRLDAIDYSDDNTGMHAWVAPAWIWSDHPRIFKTTLTLEARDTDRPNRYRYTAGRLADIEHPYWTPEGYFGTALTLEWRHDLARDFFIGAQQHWYDLRATFNLSNDGNRGIAWAADYVREWHDRWVLRLGLQQTLSRQWDDLRAGGRLTLRF